jgi:hypothetical protein
MSLNTGAKDYISNIPAAMVRMERLVPYCGLGRWVDMSYEGLLGIGIEGGRG